MPDVQGARTRLPGHSPVNPRENPMEEIECIVIGAGVVGLAIAASLARSGRETIVLEGDDSFGTGTSSRNSEVVHAGLYYAPGSLKARLCVAGREQLYRYCKNRNVLHSRCGKLVVATRREEREKLMQLQRRAQYNGVDDLEYLDGVAANRLEPSLSCELALYSPSSGMIDTHELMLCLIADVEAASGVIAFSSPFVSGRLREDGGAILEIGGKDAMSLKTRLLVNCAGLSAQPVARSLEGFPEKHIPPLYFGKGNYFTLDAHFPKPPFSHLIYPVPGSHSLGTHLNCTLDGRIRLGPDLQWVDAPSYDVDSSLAAAFEESVRRYWPDMPEGKLQSDIAGIRPKLSRADAAPTDFCILGKAGHGRSGIIHLFGIESPGLTSSLAIADYVTCLAAE